MPSVVLFVNLKIVEGEIDAFIKRAREHRERVLASEPDCKSFDISIPEDDENTANLYEVYADEAAFQHHLETPYMKAYMEDTKSMIESRERTKARLKND